MLYGDFTNVLPRTSCSKNQLSVKTHSKKKNFKLPGLSIPELTSMRKQVPITNI